MKDPIENRHELFTSMSLPNNKYIMYCMNMKYQSIYIDMSVFIWEHVHFFCVFFGFLWNGLQIPGTLNV